MPIPQLDLASSVNKLMEEIKKDPFKVVAIQDALRRSVPYHGDDKTQRGIMVLNAAFNTSIPIPDMTDAVSIGTLKAHPILLDAITIPIGFQYDYPLKTRPAEIMDFYQQIYESAKRLQ